MFDRSITYIDLAMRADSLENVPDYPLPERYGWRYYMPGDELNWARIETSAGEFERIEDGLESFRRYYPDTELLADRMIFLTDNGVPFATATAWYTEDGEGWLHWVSVDAAHQGRGLSKPLMSVVLRRMRQLGYASAILGTQTASWVAVKVYHEFGFRPSPRTERDAEGWKLVSEKTGIDFSIE